MPAFPLLSLRLFLLTTLLAAWSQHALAEKAEPPTRIQADEASAREGQYAEARGNVELTRGDLTVKADWARYTIPDDRVRAGDHVTVNKGQEVLSGSHLDMSINAREGDLLDPVFQMTRGNVRGDAVKLIFGGPNKYSIRNGRMTTCSADRDDWYIHAGALDLDYNSNTGEAWNGWIEFQGAPIFYYPWIDFPLDGSRKSGILAPSIGGSSSNGLQVKVPIYFNLAPNYDATLSPSYLSRRGVMLGGEFRYLGESYSGQLQASGIQDRIEDKARSGILFKHQQKLSDRLQLDINAQKVNDDEYLADFGDEIAVASQSNLPREGKLTYSGDDWNGFVRWQRYQTLNTSTNTVEKPYDRIPQLYVSAAPQLLQGVQTTVSGEITDFSHPSETSGLRTWAYPSIAMPFNQAWGFITPKIGVHATMYQLSSTDNTASERKTRTLPIASVDSGLYFERETHLFGTEMAQTLEPRAYYLYIPYRKQSDLPVFDSGETDLSFTQLFSENQFSGQDRINDANQLTLALTSRLFESDSGIERINATIGQRYYFTEQQVTLTSAARDDTERSSNLLMTLGARLWGSLYSSYEMQYNQKDNNMRRGDLSLTWTPGQYKSLNMRYVNNRITDIRQFDISGQWPLGAGWYGLGRFNYSISDNRPLQMLGGIEYNANCWAFRFAAQRYATSTTSYQTNFFALLELGGVAGIGSNPLDTIRQSIPGYSDTYTPSRF